MSQVDLLRNAPIFESLSDFELEALAASLKERIFPHGVVIFHKGSPGNSLYLIEFGQGADIRPQRLGPGDHAQYPRPAGMFWRAGPAGWPAPVG